MTATSLAVGLLLLLVLAWAVFAYNRLVRLRNQARTAWADIDVQLTRRHDLVPQLVAAVQGYVGHEQRGARSGDDVARAGGGPDEPGPARRGGVGTGAGAVAAVRAEGSLSGPQGQRELRAAAARPGRGRGTPAVRAPLLQRRRARLQRRRAARSRSAGARAASAFATPSSSRPTTRNAPPSRWRFRHHDPATVATMPVDAVLAAAGGAAVRAGTHPVLRRDGRGACRRQPRRDRTHHRARRRQPDPPRHLSRHPDALQGPLRQSRRRRPASHRGAARRQDRAVVHRRQAATACASTPATTTSCRCRPTTPTRCAIAPRASSVSSTTTTSCTGTRSAPAGRSRSSRAASKCVCPNRCRST